MGNGLVRCEWEGGLATITLAAPPLNLVSIAMTTELDACLARLESDGRTRALLLHGAGGKAFCAGSHIDEFDGYMSPGAVVRDKLEAENAMYSRLAEFPWPTVAAVEGVAFGGGLELALCCDLIVADPGARFAMPEVRLGVFPGSGGTVRLPRRIGAGRAAEMIFLGDPIDAQTAHDWALVNRVSAPGEALTLARDLADRLARGPASLLHAKAALSLAGQGPDSEAISGMFSLIDKAFCTEDCREGVSAFQAKRAPSFKGR